MIGEFTASATWLRLTTAILQHYCPRKSISAATRRTRGNISSYWNSTNNLIHFLKPKCMETKQLTLMHRYTTATAHSQVRHRDSSPLPWSRTRNKHLQWN